MPRRDQRKRIEQLRRIEQASTRELLKRLQEARERIATSILKVSHNPRAVAAARARNDLYSQVGGVYNLLARELDSMIKDMVEETAVDWHKAAVEDIGGRSPVAFNRERLKSYWELLDPGNGEQFAAVYTRNMTKAQIQTLRQAHRDAVMQGNIEGLTLTRQQAILQQKWDEIAGDTASGRFIDAAGRRWDNAAYLDMLVRTTAARVARDSYFDTLAANGDDLVQIENVDSEACDICDAWDGVIISISGATKGYPTYAQARAAGWGHPNCRCPAGRVDESLDKKEIQLQANRSTPGFERLPNESDGAYRRRMTKAMAEYSQDFGGNLGLETKAKPDASVKVPVPTDASVTADAKALGFVNASFKGIPPVTAAKVNDHLGKLKADYSWTYTRMHDVTEPGVYASSNAVSLGMNPSYFGDAAKFTAALKRDVAAGWHPRGCDTMESVLTHEYAHHLTIVDITMGSPMAKSLQRVKTRYTKAVNDVLKKHGIMKNMRMGDLVKMVEYGTQSSAIAARAIADLEPFYISDYAAKNLHEFTAEAFAMAMHDQKPSTFAKEVARIISEVKKTP